MPTISADDVQPYYHALVYKVPDEFDLSLLEKRVIRHINSKNKPGNKFDKKSGDHVLRDDPDFHVVYFEHTNYPSWFRIQREGIYSIDPPRDREWDLLALYVSGEYLFAYTTCSQLENRVDTAIRLHHVKRQFVRRISQALIKRIFNNSDLSASTVSLGNVFGAGGTAPESKSYHGSEAVQFLSPAMDSGYGIKLFKAKDRNRNMKPTAASAVKRKVWRHRVENLETFKEVCNAYVEIFNTVPTDEKLSILVDYIDPFQPGPDDYVGFHMDSTHDGKMIDLKLGTDMFPEWGADLSTDSTDRVTFTLVTVGAEKKVDYEFVYDLEKNEWTFEPHGDDSLQIVFTDQEDRELGRPVPLSKYLEKQLGFTFLFSEGRAFRDGDFHRNNKFKLPFKHCDIKTITWPETTVVITRESKAAGLPKGKKTIIQHVSDVMTKTKPLYLIVDDGSEEVADHVMLWDDKIILAHAKRSKTNVPSIRVDDLQVVCSQAVKNLRFFNHDNFTDHIINRLYEKTKKKETLEKIYREFRSAV